MRKVPDSKCPTLKISKVPDFDIIIKNNKDYIMTNLSTLDVSTNLDTLIKDFDLYIKNADKIVSDAINTGITAGRTKSLFETRTTWNIKAGSLKNYYTKTVKAHPNNDNTGQFVVESSSINLLEFGGKQLTKINAKGKLKRQYKGRGGTVRSGVNVKLHKKKRPTTLEHSWVAKGKYGNAIWREDPNNPRKRIYMASITPTSMYKQEGVDVFIKTFIKSFTKRFNRRIIYYTTPKAI
jgi:hypothetical protein